MPAKKSAPSSIIKEMRHQKKSLEHDAKHPLVFDMSDAGTGKTYVRVTAYARRRRAKRAGCLMVLCPRSLMTSAWKNDFQKFAPDMRVVICGADSRDNLLSDGDVFIVNHDGVKAVAKLKPAVMSKFTDLVIDESDAYKHMTSARSKAAAKVAAHFQRRALLSATPTGNGVTHIWHQMYILDGGKRLGSSFYAFRNAVATPKQVGPSPNALKWTDKPDAELAVFDLIADVTIRHRREDCLDIPSTQYITVPYELTPKQLKVYQDMEAAAVAQVAGQTITAINAAAVLTKLLQISSGAVYDGLGNYKVVDTGRYELIIELTKARKHPLVLFFWKHQLEQLKAHADAESLHYAVFDGSTSDKNRAEQERRYQNGEYDLIFGHPKTVAYGYTFTRGTSIIWSCPTYDRVWWEQANQRQARIGQKEKTEIVTVVAPGTRETDVLEFMNAKGERLEKLLWMFSTATGIGIEEAAKVIKVAKKFGGKK